jgi:VanZ family protein
MRTGCKKHVIWWCVLTLTTLLIWGQSLLTRDLSAAQSGALQGLLGRLFGEGIYSTFLYQNIRKVAHFTEYAVLGAEWAGFRLSVSPARRPTWQLMLVAGPLTATCDELLQFVSARAPRVTDVLLDCSGYFVGFAVIFGISIFSGSS